MQPNGATEEEMQALDKSPTPSSPECVRHANQDQQAKDKAGGPSSKTPAPRHGIASGQRQPSIEDCRAGAALSAERQTAVAAAAATITTAATNAAPVVEQQPFVTAGLSARAQGKQPALPVRQTTATRAGPSREHELLETSTSRLEVNGTRTENNPPPPPETSTAQSVGAIRLTEENMAAVAASEITHRHNIDRGTRYVVWRPSSMIFHMSLADIARELGVGDSGRLYFTFNVREVDIPDDFAMGDGARFTSFMKEFVGIITRQYLNPEARRQGLDYSFYISDAPIRM